MSEPKYVNLDTVSIAWLSIWTVLGATPVPIFWNHRSLKLRRRRLCSGVVTQTAELAPRDLARSRRISRELVSDERHDKRRTAGDSRRHSSAHLHPPLTRQPTSDQQTSILSAPLVDAYCPLRHVVLASLRSRWIKLTAAPQPPRQSYRWRHTGSWFVRSWRQ